jgi:hypothetical protein
VSRRDVDDCGGAGQIGGDGAQRSTGVADEGAQIPLAQPWTVPRCRVDRFDEFDEESSGGFEGGNRVHGQCHSGRARSCTGRRACSCGPLENVAPLESGLVNRAPRNQSVSSYSTAIAPLLPTHRARAFGGCMQSRWHPESGTTSGLVAYLDGRPIGSVRGRAVR